MLLFLLLLNCFTLAYILEVWFGTNVVAEYAELLKLPGIYRMDEYLQISKRESAILSAGTYLEFLKEYYSNHFIVRLISCPTCLSLWLSAANVLVVSFFYGPLTLTLLLPSAFFTLFFYRILNKLA